jgi:hypothetical protein
MPPPDEKMIYPANRAFEITPGPGMLEHVTRAIYIGGYGDIRVITIGNDNILFVGMAAGLLHSIRVKRVLALDTTATNIIGLW